MSRDNLIMTIGRLRIFVLTVCLLNFTACAAKNKTSMVTNEIKERSVTTGDYNHGSGKTISTSIDSMSSNHINNKTIFDAVTDSVKSKNVVNRRGVEKRDVKIDSITSNYSKIYGIVISERSSVTINSDETINAFGLEVSLDLEDDQGGENHLVRTDEMSKQEKTKFTVKDSNKSNRRSGIESSEMSTPWLLVALTTLLTSWWFWILILIVGIAIYKRVTGVNLLQIAIFKIKSWLS